MKQLSKRHNELSIPMTIEMTQKSRALKAKGHDVISLSLGEPDFDTPDYIKDAAKEGIDNNYSHYMPVSGYLDSREAISQKFKRDNNLNYSPEQIVISTGAKQSLANVVLALVNPGDEVIIPAPYWVSYLELVKMAEGKSVVIETTLDSSFKISPDQLRDAMSSGTRLMIFSTPNNPSGAIYTRDELKELAKVIATKKDFYVICDEIYELINYTGHHESLAQFEEIYDQVITVNGLSKGFAMTGWRVGYMGAPEWIAKACDKIQSVLTSGTCSISQRALIGAMTHSPKKVEYLRDEFKERRDLMVQGIREVLGFKTIIPQGAFYIFPNIEEVLEKTGMKDDMELCIHILENAHVGTVPGSAFGLPGYIRFSYAASREELSEALSRVESTIEKLMT